MPAEKYPLIRDIGISGLLVTFSDELGDAANGAALAFRAAVDDAEISGVRETTTSLTSTFISFDPTVIAPAQLRSSVHTLLDKRDWLAATLPTPHDLWHIPVCFGGEFGPQLGEAASLVGVSEDQAVRELEATTLRVMTIGFAPGQPYLGSLPPNWAIPRQTGLTKSVPKGAVTVAIRQITTFTNAAPTGWRHIGQMAFENFRQDAEMPFALKPGDEVRFHHVPAALMTSLLDAPKTPIENLPGKPTGNGGASVERVT